MCSPRHSIFCIMPPHILRAIMERGTLEERTAASRTLAVDSTFRSLRATATLLRADRAGGRRAAGNKAAHDLHGEQPAAAAGNHRRQRKESPGRERRSSHRRGLQRAGRDLGFLFRGLRSAVDRRRGHAAQRDGALRQPLQQCILERPADGVWRWRRAAVQPFYDCARRHRT